MEIELFYRWDDGVEPVFGDGWMEFAVANDVLLFDTPEDAEKYWGEHDEISNR